jgi:hypothetical protein
MNVESMIRGSIDPAQRNMGMVNDLKHGTGNSGVSEF